MTPGLPTIGDQRPTRPSTRREWAVDEGVLHGLEWEADDGATPVLAVHGIAANSAAWALVADRLRATRMLAPDLRGCGRSGDLPGPWSTGQLADDLARVLDAADVDKAVVTGHALGAFTGVRFAERHPDRVEALVLVDGGLPVPPEGLSALGTDHAAGWNVGDGADAAPRTFASRAEYLDHWREHPGFGRWWNPAMEQFLDAGLQPAADGGFVLAANPDAVRENARELDGGDGYAEALLSLRTLMAFIRSPKGLANEAPLYSPEYAEDWVTRISGIANVEADAANHHTVLLAPHGADVTAAVIRGVVDIGATRERARAAHPATGRLRVVKAAKAKRGPRPDARG